ncbi:MAG: Ig-like domain-containing protein [Flavobacterium sp.]|nr:Ig-like domain-containing protein [Flavobacterium sp.]
MKIISLKLKIRTILLFFVICHGIIAQNRTDHPSNNFENHKRATKELNNSKTGVNLLLPPVITGNFSICQPGPTTTQLTATLPPAAGNPWVSSNPAVATIDAAGLVTQVSFGATTITYTDSLGNTYSENVYVSTFPTIATPNGTSTCAGGTLQIDGSLFPNALTPWISLTPAIASVDNVGLITGNSGGIATIQYMNLGGCTTTTAITINPLLIPNVTCGATTTSQITFNWSAVAGATTYVRSYQIGAGPFQSAGSSNAVSYTLTGLLPSSTITFYVAPSGAVGSCFQVGQVTCSTLPCNAATTPLTPTIGVITPPSCVLATGSVAISGLPAGNWTLNQTGTAANSIAGNTASTTVSGLATGNYTFTVTNDLGCTSVATANVNIPAQPPTPAAPISTGDITQCQQLPIQTLDANNAITPIVGQTLSWYTLAVGGVLVPSPTLNAVGTITYYAQANDGTCDSTTRTSVKLTITGAPAAPISTGDITQCEQFPIQTLDANNAITPIVGQTVSWYTLAVGGVLVPSPTLNAVGTATYYAQANDGTCDSTTRTSVKLTITGAPAAPISTGDITQCEQLPIQTLDANNAITVLPGQTISWHTLAVGGVLVPSPTLNTVGTVTYYAQAFDGTCNSLTRTSVKLTITGAPAAPISTGDITQCEQLPIQTLDANNAITVLPGQTISWYTLAVGGVLVPSPTLNAVGTVTYYAQANDGTCDSTTRTSVKLTITGAPAAPISTGDITQCEQLPIQTLDANNAITVLPGQTISWYTLAVGGVLVPSPTLNTVGTITYYAQANDGTCESTTRTSVKLTITGAPAAPISTGDITQCEQLPIQTLDANNAITVIPGQTISWYTLAVGGVLVASPTLNAVGTITYYAQVNDGTCDSTTRTSVKLTITGTPAAPISTGDITQCEQLPIQTLDANNAITVIPGQTISWYTRCWRKSRC